MYSAGAVVMSRGLMDLWPSDGQVPRVILLSIRVVVVPERGHAHRPSRSMAIVRRTSLLTWCPQRRPRHLERFLWPPTFSRA